MLFAPDLPPRNDIAPAGIVLFIGVLPLLNGIGDFLSVGLTRWCLRLGLVRRAELGDDASWRMRTFGGRPWLWVLVDVAGALTAFTLLGAAILAVLTFVRPQDGLPLIEPAVLFAAIRGDLAGHWWLGFLLFSTLIPTILHLALFTLTAAFLSWGGLRRWTYDRVMSGAGYRMEGGSLKRVETDAAAGLLGAAVLSIMVTLSLLVPAFAVVETGRWIYGSPEALFLPFVDFFEWIACAMGAYCEPLAP